MMKPRSAMLLVIAGLAAAAAIANYRPAVADELNNLSSSKSQIQSRIDQLAAPQPGDQPNSPAANVPDGAGSFPRSTLIPGTDTSVRIGGTVDGTTSYHGH